jgi:hypothetical protein
MKNPHSATPATMVNLGSMVTQKANLGELYEIVLTVKTDIQLSPHGKIQNSCCCHIVNWQANRILFP